MDGTYSQAPVVSQGTPLTMAAILSAVSQEYGVPVDVLKGHNRVRRYYWARQAFYWIAYDTGVWSSIRIARFLGDRDHTTILRGISEIERRMKRDPETDKRVRRLAAVVASHHPQDGKKFCSHCGNPVD